MERQATRRTMVRPNPQLHAVLLGLMAAVVIPLLASCDGIGVSYRPPGTQGLPTEDTRPRPWAYAAFTRGREDTFNFYATGPVIADLSQLPHGDEAVQSCGPADYSGNIPCILRWRAAPEDTGRYAVTFRLKADWVGGIYNTLVYTVAHDADRRPFITSSDTVNLVVGVAREVTLSASDPDGDPIFEFGPDRHQVGAFRILSWAPRFVGSTAYGTARVVADGAGYAYFRFTATNATSADGGFLARAP